MLLPSHYALPFGGFVNLPTSLWFGAGSVVSSLWHGVASLRGGKARALPPDMSASSLVGGGLIAGGALAAHALGIVGLLALLT